MQQKQFFDQVNSHGFVTALMDEGFLTGMATFLISNYTVLVWTVVDLTLILAARNIDLTIGRIRSRFRDMDKEKFRETNLRQMREAHGAIAQLVECLGSCSGLNTLYLSFYLSTLYFLWTHFLSFTLPQGLGDGGSTVSESWIYLSYQAWASWRQLQRLALVSYYAMRISRQMERRSWMRIVLGMEGHVEDYADEKRRLNVSLFKGFFAYFFL